MTDQLKNAPIQQLNINYVAVEDRLLLKIGMANQTELSVWLTYRVTKKLAPLLQQTPINIMTDERINTPYNQELEQQFAKQEMTQKLNFSTDYEQRQSLNQGLLFLVTDCRLLEKNNQQRVLKLICANNRTLTIALNDELLLGLANMLKQACQQAEWLFTAPEQTLSPASDNKRFLLH
jgi:hypothetical protein